MRRPLLLVVLSAVAATVAAPALASPPYPEGLREDLSLSYTPACNLCHEEATNPVGAADTPFAKSLEARGLVADSLPSLAAALALMQEQGVSSIPGNPEDLDMLSWGGNPNVAESPVGGYTPPPTYGCAVAALGDATDGLACLASLTVLGLLLVRSAGRKTHRAAGSPGDGLCDG